MGFCHRCGDLVHGANCLKCGGRSVMSVTSGLASTGSRNDPWISAYQNILEGGISKPNKRMSMPATPVSPLNKLPPLVIQKQCNGCSKPIHQAKVYVEPGKPTIIYCEKCYTEKFTKGVCPACFKPVMSKTDVYITHNKRSWHTPCFTCYKCRIDMSTQPMVDLKGRPCCEDCLMAQAGSEQSPLAARPSPPMSALSHTSTPVNRSLASSPSPAPTSSLYFSASNESDSAENRRFLSADPPAKLQLNFSPTDLTADRGSNSGNSPLSAHSTSSQSSLSTSFKPAASSGYTSGTSSTYSSLGRKPIDPKLSSSIAAGAGLVSGTLQSPLTESSIQSFRRPSSALSIHSYPSSRADSPAPTRQDLQEEGEEEHEQEEQHPEEVKQGETEGEGSFEDEQLEETTLSRPLPMTPPRDRAITPLFEPTRSPARFTVPYNEEDIHGIQRSGTSSNSLAGSAGRYSKSSSSNSLVDTADVVKRTSTLTVSSAKPVTTVAAPPPVERPIADRVRSRSSAGVPSAGLVRARTEALLNQAQQHTSSPPPARPTSHYYNSSPIAPRTTAVSSSMQEEKRGSTKYDVTSQESRESKALPLEVEPNRSNSSLFRHGRQRSNTVGEAISLPEDDILTEEDVIPSQRRASVVPAGHCHKCHERVTENGVMLQGGVKFHIGCFLCNGCKQVFTESQFHVVNGRPYHPACVPLAPSIPSSAGVVTKCQRCSKVTGNRWVRVAGLNYHPQCFTCQQCDKVLNSATPFYDVDGRVECGECCDERDRRPKIVPVARATDHFPVPPMAVPLDPSGPIGGMMATSSGELSRSGSLYGSPLNGTSSPLRSPGSPSYSAGHDLRETGGHSAEAKASAVTGAPSPVQMMASPLAIRSTPPVLTSLFSTRTRPLPKFGGTNTCPRCQQPVGVFDQVPGPKGDKWHKRCLNCKDCKKVLDSSALTKGEGEAFCRGCFNKPRVRA